MIPVRVANVSVCPPYQGYVVVLHEIEGERWLPIFIGAAEAQAISLLLRNKSYSRPLTFDLFYNLLDAANAQVEQVSIIDLKENTFYALVEMKTVAGDAKIDARPSDAIAIGLRSKATITVAEHVMNTAGVTGDRSQSQINNLNQIAELNKKLQSAIENESYEEAASLRDRIRDLEKKENLR
ncbi:hypothetical protein CEE37_06135 [candidate division LCP-89 bacterium B3_LCP]|uniref:BFN domain-containing protein n=1 Tax=candidate division LCP-89 bacterium B3_LCP TaxID=2012998 RepID=A0A532V276_UNCL8|nr:MAG: hypothetical protein CEE37_06135 [candidate division LCP-89 bacterium B3_LCP]